MFSGRIKNQDWPEIGLYISRSLWTWIACRELLFPEIGFDLL